MSTPRVKTPSQLKQYAVNRKVNTHRKNVTNLRADFADLSHVVDFERLMNAQVSEVETLQKLMKKVLKLTKREEVLVNEGLITNEEIQTQREPNRPLLEALGKMRPIEKKRLKYTNDTAWAFGKAVIAAHSEEIAAHTDVMFTLDVFYKSINIKKYTPSAREYAKIEAEAEAKSAGAEFGMTEKEMFAAFEPIAEVADEPKAKKPKAKKPKAKKPKTEKPKAKPPPLPTSKPPPIPTSKPPPIPTKAAKPKTELVESDSDDDFEALLAAADAADAARAEAKGRGKAKPKPKAQFRSLFLDHFGDALEEAAALDPVEERTDEICEDFLQQCKEWTAVGSSAGLGKYARKSPAQALKVIRELYINGAHEFLDPEGVW